MVSLEDVRAASAAVYRVAHRTPLLYSASLSGRFGGEVWLKAENLQHSGSFKPRGAAAKLASMSDAERARGVITGSAGNHAQGVALAAAAFGARAVVVMPEHATLRRCRRRAATAPR